MQVVQVLDQDVLGHRLQVDRTCIEVKVLVSGDNLTCGYNDNLGDIDRHFLVEHRGLEFGRRDDVLRAIDAICAYYARNEPSSPVPLLLQRSKRLVTMSFMDILKEIVPESVPNVQKITGKTDA